MSYKAKMFTLAPSSGGPRSAGCICWPDGESKGGVEHRRARDRERECVSSGLSPSFYKTTGFNHGGSTLKTI